ncbi:MAG: glucokinase [Nitrospirota bacterium]
MKKILAADIGGTNSRFAFFEVDQREDLNLLETMWLKTSGSSSFTDLIGNLKIEGFPLSPEDSDVAVFAIAGPVEQGIKCSPPFISWDIDISNAKNELGFRKVFLINDFVAQAYACCSQIGRNAERVKTGTAVQNSTVSVIGAGTALGKAVIIPDEQGGYLAIPSEGGHASFPFETMEECEFRDFLINETGDSYITWNKVVSGNGLIHIHQYLTGEKLEPQVIVEGFTGNSKTLEWASKFYGRACRNFALETLSLGGIYISGGVAANTPDLVTHKAFADEFEHSDTLSDLLIKIPVFLIREQNAGLWGCAFLAQQKLRED